MRALTQGLLITCLLTLCHTAVARLGGDFTLTDQQGQPFQLQQLRGKVVILTFGYTYCPDICPTELAGVSRVLDGLGADAERVRGLFITLDPQRDTPQVLKAYLSYFNSALIGLTGTDEAIRQVATGYRVQYEKHPQPDGSYSLDHSANLYLIDQQGALFSVIPHGLPPAHVLRVVQAMLKAVTPN